MVYAALSHDIIAHEMTHALLDGIHKAFREPSNPDVLAFHEAFADIIALLQQFANIDIVRSQSAAVRGDLSGSIPRSAQPCGCKREAWTGRSCGAPVLQASTGVNESQRVLLLCGKR